MEEIYFRKRKRTRIKELYKGDVFVAEIFDDIFVYGQVMNPCIKNEFDSFYDKGVLVVFYQIITKGIDIDFYQKSEKRVLVTPQIIYRKVSFNNGALKLIRINHHLPKISYGFYSLRSGHKDHKYKKIGIWVDEEYNIKILRPKYLTPDGLTTEYGMESLVKKGIIEYNKTLQLNNDDIKKLLL